MSELLDRRGPLLFGVIFALAFALHVPQLLVHNNHQDFFIYRAGAVLALRGDSPYNSEALRELVAAQYPGDERFIANNGFFLAPQAVAFFTPFAVVPWPLAKVLWSLLSYGAAALAVWNMTAFMQFPASRKWLPVVAGVVIFDPLTHASMVVAQTTLLMVSLVILGEVLRQANRPHLGVLLWALAFMKPHLALPLIPLVAYLGGWRRALELIGVVILLNLIGCALTAGSWHLIPEYLDHLANGHKLVLFNRVELNPQITSWNRFLIAIGGPAIEQNAVTTLAGYAVWGLLVATCVAITWKQRHEWPSPAWALAVTVIGIVVCCQLLAYELVLLAAVAPLVLDWQASNRKWPLFLILFALVVKSIPFEVPNAFITLDTPPTGLSLVAISHRSVGVMLLALAVMGLGWPKREV